MASIHVDAPTQNALSFDIKAVDSDYALLDRARTFKLHLRVIGLIIFLNIFWVIFTELTGHDSVLGIRRLFLVYNENSLPTFFSAIALLACSTCAALVWRLERSAKAPDASLWGLVALILGYMAVDEALQIHELASVPMAALWKNSPIQYDWVVPFGILAAVISVRLLPLWWRQPANIKRGLLVAGVIYIGSAIGMEIISGVYAKMNGTKGLGYDLIYQAMVVVEEAGEMIGVALLLRTLLGKLEHIGSGIALVSLSTRSR